MLASLDSDAYQTVNPVVCCMTTVACVATVHFDRSSGLRLDGLGGDVHLETVNRSSLDGLLIHSSSWRISNSRVIVGMGEQ